MNRNIISKNETTLVGGEFPHGEVQDLPEGISIAERTRIRR